MMSCYEAQTAGFYPVYLLNMIDEDGSRSRSHGISRELLSIQAEAIDIPLVQKRTGWEDYEENFKEAVCHLKRQGIEKGVFGDIDLQGHRDWVERISKELSIEPILPLWGRRREDLLREFLEAGFEAIVVATKGSLLGGEWLGRRIDEELISDLKNLGGIDLWGENGEYHTFVIDGPLFKKRIIIGDSRKIEREGSFFLEISGSSLHKKEISEYA